MVVKSQRTKHKVQSTLPKVNKISKLRLADIIVVGGGVIGLTIARALAKRGAGDVVLIEKDQPGLEASWAAGGILGPQAEADQTDDFFRLGCASRDLYPSFADSLKEETGMDVELDKTGTLYLGFTADDEQEMRQRYEWQTSEGLPVEWLSRGEARKLEPIISRKTRCALRFPNDWQVENRRLVEALVKANEKLGVRLITECEVKALHTETGRVTGVESSTGSISAPVVVLAAGAWTSLIQSTGTPLPKIDVEPVRGQMLSFETQPPIAQHVLYSSLGYLVPRRDGHILAGSTTEFVGFDKDVTIDGVSEIREMAVEIAPLLDDSPLVDSWSGLRPCAQDGLPVLGPHEEVEGLFYATGHYRNGILLAPITGESIADIVTGVPMSPLFAVFSPNRF